MLESFDFSATRGVCFCPSRGKWLAFCMHKTRTIQFGFYDTREQAVHVILGVRTAMLWIERTRTQGLEPDAAACLAHARILRMHTGCCEIARGYLLACQKVHEIKLP